MWQEEVFSTGSEDVNTAIRRLIQYLEFLPLKYQAFTEEELLRQPAPGKWSKQEILGHLIDSALINWKRFTEIPIMPSPYSVQSYNQEALVRANNYRYLPLEHMLNLWKTLNRQIVYSVESIPRDKMNYPVHRGGNQGEMKSLAWLIGDYVVHLEHHWNQIVS